LNKFKKGGEGNEDEAFSIDVIGSFWR